MASREEEKAGYVRNVASETAVSTEEVRGGRRGEGQKELGPFRGEAYFPRSPKGR